MNKILLSVLIFISLVIVGCSNNEVGSNLKENNVINQEKDGDIMATTTNIKVIINDEEYNATIEDNEAAQLFVSILPKEYNMSELNGNEKYFYMNSTLPTNSFNPKHIERGDIMLYGNNCLVVFYKSFDTSYSYTKIGHIDNLPDLGLENITVKFEK